MIFCELQENHLDLLKKYLPAYANGDCDLSLVSLLSRGMASQFRFAEFQGTHLILEQKLDNQTVFSMPIGQSAAPQALFDELAALAKEKHHPLRFFGLIDADQSVLAQAYPHRELFAENNPDRWDYVYACSDFVRLEGSHFHGKRNFVKRFFKACPEAKFEVYSNDLLEPCLTFLNEWYEGREMTDSLRLERGCIEKVLKNWDRLPVYGGVLHDNERLLGLTYGARSAPDVLAVHVEKATRSVPGAYPALSQAFAQSLPLCIEYLNREEDLGIAGLRKAKQDWHPIAQLKKGIIEVH